MADKRELILARLLDIATGITGIVTVVRNAQLLDDAKLPAIQLIDADEATEDSDMQPPGRTLPPGPARSAMSPEFYITVSGKPEDIGTAVNVYRARLIRAVLTDATLLEITGANGIRYNACAVDLSRAREMQASMGVSFTFTYLLKVADLEGI